MRIERQKDSVHIDKLRPLLPPIVSDYIEDRLVRYTPSTVLAYIQDLKDFFEWMITSFCPEKEVIQKISLEDLERLVERDINHYIAHLKTRAEFITVKGKQPKKENTDNTISRKISALKNFFGFLTTHTNPDDSTNQTYLVRNIVEKTTVYYIKKDHDVRAEELKDRLLLEDEIENFQHFILQGYGELELSTMQRTYWLLNRERDAAIISVMLGTGIRVGELASIRIKDLYRLERKIRVERKRSKESFVYYPQETQNYLSRYLEIRKGRYNATARPTDPLFVSNYKGTANPISKSSVQKMVSKYAKLYEKDMTAHSLRHSFATFLLNQTKDIRGVQEALGHASTETLQVYTHLFDNDKKRLIDKAFSKDRS